MDVRLSVEQRALRDSAADVVNAFAPKSVRDLDDAERAAKLEAAVEASGWRELRTATDDGKPLASAVEVALIAEELGRGPADAAFVGPTLAAELRRLSGAPTGDARETVALVADLSALACAVDGVLPSRAVAIDARGSMSALGLVESADGHLLAEVALPGTAPSADLTRPVAVVDSAAPMRVCAQARPLTAEDLARWTGLGLAITCAELVGAMRGAVRLASDYALTRRQYGVAIGSFQAVQHRLADALVALEGARSIALYAAWAVDALPASDALAAAAKAKAYCARAGRAVCEAAIQVHGGIGNTWECMAHLYLRRSLFASDVLGGVGPNLARVLENQGIGSGHGLR